jgi:hypothetical protein
MRWNLRNRQSNRLGACHFAYYEVWQTRPLARMDRDAALQVWQGEGFLSIAAISGTDQVEECVIFRNWYKLPIAKGPTYRGKIEANHPYLAYIRCTHLACLLFWKR